MTEGIPTPVLTATLGADKAAALPAAAFRPATVVAYNEAAPATVTVRPDDSNVDIGCRSLLNRPLYIGARVMLVYQPPGGALIVGIIGTCPPPFVILTISASQTIVDATDTTVVWDEIRGQTPDIVVNSGVVSLPYTGLWAASAVITWNAFAFVGAAVRTESGRIERCDSGGALIEQIAGVSYDSNAISEERITMNPTQQGWFANTGEQLRVRVRHDSGFNRDIVTDTMQASFTVRWVGAADVGEA